MLRNHTYAEIGGQIFPWALLATVALAVVAKLIPAL